MASACSSSGSNSQLSCPQRKYDVFLSFRGEDTRNNFTSHLYHRLVSRGIVTFLDDKTLKCGDSLTKELVKAIEESQVAIIIFSENYAESRWCLNELVKIMECKENNGLLVIPIFHYVDPSHVRHQGGSFEKEFEKHKLRYKDEVEGWRTALTAAADLTGYDIHDGINQAECIGKLVDEISPIRLETSLSYLTDLMGIDAHLKEVNSLLEIQSNDVRIVWIWGIPGVGKTRIARAIFYTHKSKFDDACFLEDIKKKDEIHSLQSVLSDLIGDSKICVRNKEDGRDLMACRLRSKKVLLVLDNIDDKDQLVYLAGDLGWFGNGSRIIATTRDKHVIGENEVVYPVATLLEHDAVQLFNQHAFENEVPNKSFEEITLEFVRHAGGHPLALKLWGSSVHKKDIKVWRNVVDQIKRNAISELPLKLKVSYDELEPQHQEMFLDIACFLKGRKQTEIKEILKSCGFGADYGLSVLIDKSLVFISEYDTIQMHKLIHEMGKYILTMQKDRGELSRLWLAEDFKKFSNAKLQGTKDIKAIWIQEIEDLSFRKEAMKDVQKLRILYINDFQRHDRSNDQYLPSNLCWIDCFKYPWESLPATFDPDSLVHLDLRQGSLRHLWIETKMEFRSLKRLDLSGCANLMRTPDFTHMTNLEYLGLQECSNLKEVHHSLRCSQKLIKLNLRDCENLERFKYVSCESLEYLYLQGCSSLEKFPKIRGKMKPEIKIHVQRSGIRKLPSAIIQHQSSLTELDLSCMKNLATLPCTIGELKCLVKLKVSYCSKLKSLPEEIGDLENLEILKAKCTLISRPPSSIVHLNRLKLLTFAKQKSEVCLEDEVYFVFPPVDQGLCSLETLNLSYCNLTDRGLPDDIGCLSSLKVLNLRGNNFEHLPQSIARLDYLQSLDLLDCKRLTQLPELPRQLYTVDADWSNDLICNSLFQNISSFQRDIFASDSLSLRVSTKWKNIPRWFHHRGKDKSILVELPENWCVCDNFLGVAVCYSGCLLETTAELLCDDGMSRITQKLALSNHSKCPADSAIHFFLVHCAGLLVTSDANGKIPNDYRHIMLSFSEGLKDFGLRLLYKDESKLKALLQIGENNDEPTQHCSVKKRGRYDEAGCSSSKKQRSQL